MSAEHDRDEELLASISDDLPADWEAAARSADAGERGRLASLRDLSRIAEFSRAIQRAPEDSVAPERWGDLLLLERLGAGAHAEVYRAWDPALQREVALKLMRPGVDDASLLEEGRAAAQVRHPNVVAVHGIDRRDGRVGLWMELVRGQTLEREVRTRGPLDPRAAVRLGVEIGSALAAVHAAGLVHRDVKPANVMHDTEGRYVLADFGLGLRWDFAGTGFGPSGTPMYMAPELHAGSPASERSDLYSLGLLLWFALAGRHPFESDRLDELRAMAARGPRPRLRELRPDVPGPLAAVIERSIAPDPSERFAGARTFVEALEAFRPERVATPSRFPARALAAAGLIALLGLAVFGVWKLRRTEMASAIVPTPVTAPEATYAVEASLMRRDDGPAARLVSGDRVRPGDRLSLEVRATRPAWIYVLNEDERGERYLLFPQPRFDARNPLSADSTFVLPGTVGGKEFAWTVTSAGGREHFLVVASPAPVPEIEADLNRLPAPLPGRPIDYAPIGEATVERLRGVGSVDELPAGRARPVSRSRAFERFRELANREAGIHGIWVRQIVLESPAVRPGP